MCGASLHTPQFLRHARIGIHRHVVHQGEHGLPLLVRCPTGTKIKVGLMESDDCNLFHLHSTIAYSVTPSLYFARPWRRHHQPTRLTFCKQRTYAHALAHPYPHVCLSARRFSAQHACSCLQVIQLITLSHELGHNFGSNHDTSSACTPGDSGDSGGNYLMCVHESSYHLSLCLQGGRCREREDMEALMSVQRLQHFFAEQKRMHTLRPKRILCSMLANNNKSTIFK